MVVDQDTLDPRSIVERLFRDVAGAESTTTITRGIVSWSNELTNHVLELKTSNPSAALQDLANVFQLEIQSINRLLMRYHAQLMPTAMHPWMDPVRDFDLWSSGKDRTIYEAYHRIFNCQNHRWSNIQSVQLNLPFCGDEEFARLHTAIRLLLPILPALSASSPIVDGMLHGWASSRLHVCCNQQKFPELKGLIIPEAVFSRQEYEERILQPIYRALAAVDADGILQKEWINSRGAIARFDRSTIEIRVLDIQESPEMDLLILRLIVAVVRALVEERWISFRDQASFSMTFLHVFFLAVAQQGFAAVCDNQNYLKAFHYLKSSANLREIWITLVNSVTKAQLLSEADHIALHRLLDCGNLSERIVQAVAFDTSREKIRSIYRSLMEALHQGVMWRR